MKTTSIEELVERLEHEFIRDPKGRQVACLLQEYAGDASDWQRFAHFSDECYTRNLVCRNGTFELMVVCWNSGQASPIHNHAGQDCWMSILEGELEEVHFDAIEQESPGGTLVERGSKVFPQGRVAFINDDIALHLVRPATTARGVSLHLYSRPIDTCNVYDPETGQVVSRSLEYHSVEGRVAAR